MPKTALIDKNKLRLRKESFQKYLHISDRIDVSLPLRSAILIISSELMMYMNAKFELAMDYLISR